MKLITPSVPSRPGIGTPMYDRRPSIRMIWRYSSSRALATSISSVTSGTSSGLPERRIAGTPVLAVAIGWIAPVDVVGEGHLGRIDVGNGQTPRRAVFTGHVHHAPIREMGHGQAGNLLQGAGFVHQRGERGAGVGKKASRLLGASPVIDIGRGAKHGDDPARLIRDVNGPSQEPAVVAMPVPQTVFGLEGLATPQRAAWRLH